MVDPTSATNGDATSELAQELLQLRQQLIEADLPSDEVKGIVEAFAARPRVELVKPLELWTDDELEDESERRKISWLSLESDQDLLAEMERRRLTSTKSDLSEEEFEREAERRGYRNSLAQYSIDEIKSYLAVQGHGKQGGSGGNYQGGGSNRRKKNRSKNRRGGGGGNHM